MIIASLFFSKKPCSLKGKACGKSYPYRWVHRLSRNDFA